MSNCDEHAKKICRRCCCCCQLAITINRLKPHCVSSLAEIRCWFFFLFAAGIEVGLLRYSKLYILQLIHVMSVGQEFSLIQNLNIDNIFFKIFYSYPVRLKMSSSGICPICTCLNEAAAGTIETIMCPHCSNVSYCTAHQFLHLPSGPKPVNPGEDRVEQQFCFPMEIVERAGIGRCLVAAKDLEEGELIFWGTRN